MEAMLDGAWGVLLVSGIVLVLGAMDGMAHLWRVLTGEEAVPYRWSRRYWRRRLVRLVCRLAALEAAWEQKKSPRSGGAERGTVGERIPRTKYDYIDIAPQTDPLVKGLRVRKVKRY